jgi:hypothetical protein
VNSTNDVELIASTRQLFLKNCCKDDREPGKMFCKMFVSLTVLRGNNSHKNWREAGREPLGMTLTIFQHPHYAAIVSRRSGVKTIMNF